MLNDLPINAVVVLVIGGIAALAVFAALLVTFFRLRRRLFRS